MSTLTKKLILTLATASLFLGAGLQANASYCVGSPVACVDYVHPIGFSDYRNPTTAEIYGLTATNFSEMIGVYDGTLLISTDTRSLSTVYEGYPTGPNNLDYMTIPQFDTLTESTILAANTAVQLGHLAVYGGYIYYLSESVITPFVTNATKKLCSSITSSVVGGIGHNIVWPYDFNSTTWSNVTLANGNISMSANWISLPNNTYYDVGWNGDSTTPIYDTVNIGWAGWSRTMCCRG